jgi:hypothetical protein
MEKEKEKKAKYDKWDILFKTEGDEEQWDKHFDTWCFTIYWSRKIINHD